VRLLTWNLFHGRARPPAGRDLLPEFGAAIAGWDWDVALLQEVPPWWPAPLARGAGASARSALTSRNALLPARRWIAERAPDLVKSNGGGCNAVLVRAAPVREHRRATLRLLPERRVVHAVRLDTGWVANVHAQVRPVAAARADVARAGAEALAWAGDAALLLGGDFNVQDPAVPGLERLGGRGVDHVLGRGWRAVGRTELPRRGALSDHPAVLVEVAPTARS
jgi:endonuclease/exonuclease/phosphatase family metal-dependent hydrolase